MISGTRTAVRFVGCHLPPNLSIFIAAIFLSNSVNVFTNIYGSSSLPPRAGAMFTSCIGSLVAAALWTALAAKAEQIEKAALSASQDFREREIERESLWNDVWLRVGLYMAGAIISSVLSLAVLVILS